MAGKQWGTTREKEEEYRRNLLVHARKGDVKAQRELMEKYGMRVYSDTEKSKLPTYYDSGKKGLPPSLTSNSTGKTVQNKRVTSRNKDKRKAKLNSGPKKSRAAKKT